MEFADFSYDLIGALWTTGPFLLVGLAARAAGNPSAPFVNRIALWILGCILVPLRTVAWLASTMTPPMLRVDLGTPLDEVAGFGWSALEDVVGRAKFNQTDTVGLARLLYPPNLVRQGVAVLGAHLVASTDAAPDATLAAYRYTPAQSRTNDALVAVCIVTACAVFDGFRTGRTVHCVDGGATSSVAGAAKALYNAVWLSGAFAFALLDVNAVLVTFNLRAEFVGDYLAVVSALKGLMAIATAMLTAHAVFRPGQPPHGDPAFHAVNFVVIALDYVLTTWVVPAFANPGKIAGFGAFAGLWGFLLVYVSVFVVGRRIATGRATALWSVYLLWPMHWHVTPLPRCFGPQPHASWHALVSLVAGLWYLSCSPAPSVTQAAVVHGFAMVAVSGCRQVGISGAQSWQDGLRAGASWAA